MKIALVTEFFYPTLGGIQEHVYNLAKQFTRKGHSVRIVTPRIFTRQPFEAWWPKDLPSSVYLPVGRSLPMFVNGSRARICVGLGLGRKLRRLLTPENFDVVHLHAPLNGTLPIMADYFSTTHTVGTFHTFYEEFKSLGWFARLAQAQIDKLDAVLGVSSGAIDAVSRYLRMQAEIIPNGIDTEYFSPDAEVQFPQARALQDGKMNILFVGRPDPRNGLDQLITAFSKILPRHPSSRLIVVGGGDGMQKYQAMAGRFPKGSVIFMGALRAERADVYRSAHIHVFPVEKATFSVTILEGMASGLAVVTCPFEGYKNLGNDGEHFVTVPFDDAQALSMKLETLIENHQLREKLGAAARAHSLQYDWSFIADRVLGVYERVLKSPPKYLSLLDAAPKASGRPASSEATL